MHAVFSVMNQQKSSIRTRSDIVAWQVFLSVLPASAQHMRRFYCCLSKLCVRTAVLSSVVDSENVDLRGHAFALFIGLCRF